MYKQQNCDKQLSYTILSDLIGQNPQNSAYKFAFILSVNERSEMDPFLHQILIHIRALFFKDIDAQNIRQLGEQKGQ